MNLNKLNIYLFTENLGQVLHPLLLKTPQEVNINREKINKR